MTTRNLSQQVPRQVLGDLQIKLMTLFRADTLEQADPDHSPLASTIAMLEAAARGDEMPPFEEVEGAVQTVCEALFTGPYMAAYEVPDEFWRTPLGQVCASALAVTGGAELVSLADASRETGIALATLQARVKAGTLRSVTVWDRSRGRPRRMLYREDVEGMRV